MFAFFLVKISLYFFLIWAGIYLNFLNIEPYKLLLKIGSAIYYYVLFIYDPPDGLYNEIKLGFFQKHVIEAEIITGKHTGVCVFISHYFITNLPFTFKCHQFSVQPYLLISLKGRY